LCGEIGIAAVVVFEVCESMIERLCPFSLATTIVSARALAAPRDVTRASAIWVPRANIALSFRIRIEQGPGAHAGRDITEAAGSGFGWVTRWILAV